MMSNVNYKKWADYIESIFFESGLKPVDLVDLACGTGTLTLLLALRGYNMLGVDSSEDMLFVAREKSRSKGVNIPFICQDISQLSIHRPVDAMICMCDGFNYILEEEELKSAFKRIYKFLKPGGILVFDISSYYKLASVLGNKTITDTGRDISLIWRNTFEKSDDILEMNLTFFVRKNGHYIRFDETHHQRGYRYEEIYELLRKSGFTNMMCFHPFTFTAPKKRGHRLVWAARKP